jgi:hypothetical protein
MLEPDGGMRRTQTEEESFLDYLGLSIANGINLSL